MSSRSKGRLTHRVKERMRSRNIVKQLEVLYNLVPGSIPNVEKMYKVDLVIRYINYLSKVCEILKSNGVLTCGTEESENIPEGEENSQEANDFGQIFVELLNSQHVVQENPVDFVDVETMSVSEENDMNKAQIFVDHSLNQNVKEENPLELVDVGTMCVLENDVNKAQIFVDHSLNQNVKEENPLEPVDVRTMCVLENDVNKAQIFVDHSLNQNVKEENPLELVDVGTMCVLENDVNKAQVNMEEYPSYPLGNANMEFTECIPNILSTTNDDSSLIDLGVTIPMLECFTSLGYQTMGFDEFMPNNQLMSCVNNTPWTDLGYNIPGCSSWQQLYEVRYDECVPNIVLESDAGTSWVNPEAESNATSSDTPQVSKFEIQRSFCKGNLFGEILLEKVRRKFAEVVAAERNRVKLKRRFRKSKAKNGAENECQNTDNTLIHLLYEKNSTINVTELDPGLCTVHVVKPSVLKHCVIKKMTAPIQRANKSGNRCLRL